MPKIDQITQLINTSIQTNVLNTSRYQGGKYYNVVELIKTKDADKGTEIFYPVVIDNEGEGTSVIVNDNYPIQIYHRILSLNYEQPAPLDNFGDENQMIKETASMTMVIISDRHVIQVMGEDLLALIAVNLPGKIAQINLSTLGLYSVNIFAQGEAIIESEIVYNREYNIGEYLLKPNSIMYSLAYTIITAFDKKCFPSCII